MARSADNYCVSCQNWLPKELFRSARTKSGLEIWCIACQDGKKPAPVVVTVEVPAAKKR